VPPPGSSPPRRSTPASKPTAFQRVDGDRSLQCCHSKGCDSFPTTDNGAWRPVNVRAWYCDKHRHQAGPGDMDDLGSGIKLSPSGVPVPVDPGDAERERVAAESHRAQLEASFADRAAEASANAEHQAAKRETAPQRAARPPERDGHMSATFDAAMDRLEQVLNAPVERRSPQLRELAEQHAQHSRPAAVIVKQLAVADASVETDEVTGTFTALVSDYQTDRDNDRFLPGAWDNAIARIRQAGKPLPLLFGHDTRSANSVIGIV
jgi:hypothetical protein